MRGSSRKDTKEGRGILAITKEILETVMTALGVLTACFGVWTLIRNHFWPSRTSIDVVYVTREVILINVTNDGPQKSTLTDAYSLQFPPELHFADVPLIRAEVSVGNTNDENKSRIIALTTRELKVSADGEALSKEKVLARLEGVSAAKMTVKVSVQESNGEITGRQATQTVETMKRFVDGRMSDEDENHP